MSIVIFSYRLIISSYSYRQKTHVLYKLTLIYTYIQVLFRLSIKESLMLIDKSSDFYNLFSKAFLCTLNFSTSSMNLTASLLPVSSEFSSWLFHKKWLEIHSMWLEVYVCRFFIWTLCPPPPPQCLCINNFSSILKASLLLNSITFSHADQWNAMFRKLLCSPMTELGPSTWQILIGF